MEVELTTFLRNNWYTYLPIDNTNSLTKIYNLFLRNKEFKPLTSMEYHYMGVYYTIKNDTTLLKQYYLKGIEHKNVYSMHSLGKYYQYNENNYALMKKYYKMAIVEGYQRAFETLCHYYYWITGNSLKLVKLIIKYYPIFLNACINNETITVFMKRVIIANKHNIKFIELLIKFKITQNDNLFKGSGILLTCLKNSMINNS